VVALEPKVQRPAVVAIAAALLGAAALLAISLLTGQHREMGVERYFLYQALTLPIAWAVVLVVWVAKRRKLELLRIGNPSANASPVPLLGIGGSDNWRRVGLTFAGMITVATGVFLVISYQNQIISVPMRTWLIALLLAAPLSVVNAFTEEIVTRWSVAEGFSGAAARFAPWVSAAIFGSVHYFGIPGGPLGALMAAFLGWLLTKSIQDTKGIGWAWAIHVAQDLLIFTVSIASLL
jgi:membrane protease YdiL (CAAX protease family)